MMSLTIRAGSLWVTPRQRLSCRRRTSQSRTRSSKMPVTPPSTRAVRCGAGYAPGRPGRPAVRLDCAATRGPRPPGAGRGGPAGGGHARPGQRPLDQPGPRGGCGRARAARARIRDERGCVDDDYGRSQAAAERPGATWPRPLTPRRTRRGPRPKNVPELALSRSIPGGSGRWFGRHQCGGSQAVGLSVNRRWLCARMPRLWLEAVPESGFGEQVDRCGWFGFEFAS